MICGYDSVIRKGEGSRHGGGERSSDEKKHCLPGGGTREPERKATPSSFTREPLESRGKNPTPIGDAQEHDNTP